MSGQIPETRRQYQLPKKPSSKSKRPSFSVVSDISHSTILLIGDDESHSLIWLERSSHGPPTPQTKNSCLAGEIDGVLTEYRVFPEHSLVHLPEHLSYEGSTLACVYAPDSYRTSADPLVFWSNNISCPHWFKPLKKGQSVCFLLRHSKLGAKYGINYVKRETEALRLTKGAGVNYCSPSGCAGVTAYNALTDSTDSDEEKTAESVQILTKEAYRWVLKGLTASSGPMPRWMCLFLVQQHVHRQFVVNLDDVIHGVSGKASEGRGSSYWILTEMPGQVVPKATLHPEWHRYPFLLCASRELIRYAGSLIVLNLGYTTYQFKSISDLWDALASFHGDPDGTHHHDEFARETGNDA
ncbi:alcohol dehydrogenase [Moniliophthora roreri MCA 2997]|uniref:Alcohol dehydrogenase n=1 Tax=Moniliophthora roreri (strain MCA 2997) TaxID=1381753 RepID=V2WS25_MONRO|nr:alcohol dehydrogenase [Moniliophthora roreri MCA 2997]